MTLILPGRSFASPSRLARSAFLWDARDVSSTARSGQALTLSRPSLATAVDVAGRIRRLAHSQWPWAWLDLDGDGQREVYLLLEPQAINRAFRSEAHTTPPWVATTLTVTAGVAAYAGLAWDRVSGATSGSLKQSIGTLADGNGVYARSIFVHADPGVSGTFSVSLEETAGTVRARATVTISAAGVITAVAGTGSVRVTAYGDGAYRVELTSTSCTAANAHTIFAANAVGAGGTATSFLVAGDQLELGQVATSYVPTTSAAVTRSAATVTAPYLVTPTSGLTAYVKAGIFLTDFSGDPYWLDLGSPGNNPHFYLYTGGGSGNVVAEHANAASPASSASIGYAYGDVVEALGTLNPADGSVVVAGRKNGGLTVAGAPSGGTPLGAAWSATTVGLNRADGGTGTFAFRSAKIGAFGRSMDQMATL